MALEAWVALGDWLDSKDRTVPTMKVRCVCLRGRTWINEVELSSVPVNVTTEALQELLRKRGFVAIGSLFAKSTKSEPMLEGAIVLESVKEDEKGWVKVYTQV